MRIVIVGAGVAGCIMVRALARLPGAEVLCLERAEYDQSESGILLYAEPRRNVVLLGDAAHGMVPTLGQGATQTIEDATLAADVIYWPVPIRWQEPCKRRGSDFMAKLERLYCGAAVIPSQSGRHECRNGVRAHDDEAAFRSGSRALPHCHQDVRPRRDADLLVQYHRIARGDAAGFRVPRGAWLACPRPGGLAIHVYAGGSALGPNGVAPSGTTAIDHVSLSCSGFREYIAREVGLDWREFVVPGTTLWQLFVYDPSGVQPELTFEGTVEGNAKPDMSDGRAYVAGSSFFNPDTYPNLRGAA